MSRSRVEAFTIVHRSSLDSFLLPCSVRKPRTASSSLMLAFAAPAAAAGGSISSLSAQSTAWLRYSAPRLNVSARSSPTTDATPRGQNSTPTTRLTAQPMATSSIRSSPTRQPAGASRLNSTTIVTVNAAWPTSERRGSRRVGRDQHRERQRDPQRGLPGPYREQQQRADTNPTTVPASARHAVPPVDAALVRSTDSVPSTTQNACCTPETSATATAAARASAPRSELRNHTERTVACLVTSNVALRRPTWRGVPAAGEQAAYCAAPG